MTKNRILSLVFAVFIGLSAFPSYAQSNFLIQPNLATPFDWQKEWGSIHVNTFADGLNDPGIPSTSNGVVPCAAGMNQCGSGVAGGAVVHGIKYDIKNSVVNCVSQQMPNYSNKGQAFSEYVCGLLNMTPIGDPQSLVYMPMTDPRSNDTTYLTPSPGWQQQIANNCIRDIYAYEPGAGAFTPVNHVFSSTEKKNWIVDNNTKGLPQGAQLPNSYYYYQQKSDNAWVYSTIQPKNGTYVAGTLSSINNYSSDLASIQAYKVADKSDRESFVVVDPNPYYDLRRYGYDGSPEPYANCPVLGLKSYDGICDPTGQAGCNLPVYGVGPTTTFTGQTGNSYQFNNYPVIWSGYVLAWSFVDPSQYWDKVKNRFDINQAHMYRQPLNDNPVLMVVRAPSYCTNEEMTSDPTSGVTDLPCLQYLQYNSNSSTPLSGQFYDLYSPNETTSAQNNVAAYTVKHDYNIDANGNLTTQVLNEKGLPVSFFDFTTQYSRAGALDAAVSQIQPPGLPITADDGSNPRPGTKMGSGAGIKFEKGTSIAIQLNNQTVKWQGKDENCMEFINAPSSTNQSDSIFVPTNTQAEFQSFVDAVSAGMKTNGGLSGLNITGRACVDQFALNNGNGVNPNGTSTWFGTTSCSQIPAPSCNQVTAISAQRFCKRPTGLYGDCRECANATDPDTLLNPGSSGTIANYYATNDSSNVCFFEAYCYSTSACPGLVSGGHVFCLAPETKITMADGTEKAIVSVKAGDEVLAFDAKGSRGLLKKAKVKATAVTESQKLVQINDLKITPLHKVVLANGRAIMAKDVKVGDKILKGSGLLMTVKTVEKDIGPITVYNLALDGADGYIADGLRVLEYPVPADMVK